MAGLRSSPVCRGLRCSLRCWLLSFSVAPAAMSESVVTVKAELLHGAQAPCATLKTGVCMCIAVAGHALWAWVYGVGM
ncbi:hypothetical protein BZA77DRAFT_312862 [Pyronema omphalodes]|nr:hypothetical protein BZA77DRAFT_312862 [Pyronema omphalodes]